MADVAQWQSTWLWPRELWVRVPPFAPRRQESVYRPFAGGSTCDPCLHRVFARPGRSNVVILVRAASGNHPALLFGPNPNPGALKIEGLARFQSTIFARVAQRQSI